MTVSLVDRGFGKHLNTGLSFPPVTLLRLEDIEWCTGSMAEVFTPARRSQVMSRIRGRGNRDTEVDGCFWHCCPDHSNLPVNNRDFWRAKLDANIRRDRLMVRTLRAQGWNVLRVWEHELSARNEAKLLRRIQRMLIPSVPPPRSPTPRR